MANREDFNTLWEEAVPVKEDFDALFETAAPVKNEGLIKGMGKAIIQGATAFPKAFYGAGATLEDLAYKGFGGKDEFKDLSEGGFARRQYEDVKKTEEYFQPQTIGWKRYITNAVSTMSQMASHFAGTAGLGTLPSMAGGAGIEKYLETRKEGYSVPRAASAGISTGTTEYLTALTPIKILSKPGLSFLERLGAGLVANVPGELVATIAEMKAVDEGILGKSYTQEQYTRALIDTAIISGLVTLGATGVVQPFKGKIKKATDTRWDFAKLEETIPEKDDFNKLWEEATLTPKSSAEPISQPPITAEPASIAPEPEMPIIRQPSKEEIPLLTPEEQLQRKDALNEDIIRKEFKPVKVAQKPFAEMTPEEQSAKLSMDIRNQILGEETEGQEAQRGLPLKPVLLVSVGDARSWIKQKSKEYGGRNQFLASKEYETAYPEVKRVFDEQKQKEKEEIGKAREVMIMQEQDGAFVLNYVQRPETYVASSGGLYGGKATYKTKAEAIEKAKKLNLTIVPEQGTSPEIKGLPTGETAPVVSKEPWQMTAIEYAKSRVLESVRDQVVSRQKTFDAQHKIEIQAARNRGETIPPEVLKDYPELQKQTHIMPSGEVMIGAEHKEILQSELMNILDKANVTYYKRQDGSFAGDAYIGQNSDLDYLNKQFPNASVNVKDVNGNRAIINLKNYSKLAKEKGFTDRIRQVNFLKDGKPESMQEGFMGGIFEQLKTKALSGKTEEVPQEIIEPIEGVTLVNNSTVMKSQIPLFQNAIKNDTVRNLLKSLGIKEVSIEAPHKFSLSEQANISTKNKTLKINADANNPTFTILHELGHIVYDNLTPMQKVSFKDNILNSEIPYRRESLQGYINLNKWEEVFADDFALSHSESPEIKRLEQAIEIKSGSPDSLIFSKGELILKEEIKKEVKQMQKELAEKRAVAVKESKDKASLHEEILQEAQVENIFKQIKAITTNIKIDQSFFDHFDRSELIPIQKKSPGLFSNVKGMPLDEVADGLGISTDKLADKLRNAISKKQDIELLTKQIKEYEPPTPRVVVADLGLKVGDKFKISGEQYTVKQRDVEGNFLIEDGDKFIVDEFDKIPMPDEGSLKKGKYVQPKLLEGEKADITPKMEAEIQGQKKLFAGEGKDITLETFGFQSIYEKLESFVKSNKIKDGYNSIIELANKVYTGGGFKSFVHDMKLVLGNLWQHYKSMIPRAWSDMNKQRHAGIMQVLAYELNKGKILTDEQLGKIGMTKADIDAFRKYKTRLAKFKPLAELQNPLVRSTIEFLSPLSTLRDSLKYKVERYKSFGDVARIEALVGKVVKKTSGFSDEQNKMLFDFLDGKLKLEGVPKEIRRYAVTLQSMNRRIGLMLVKRGLITREAWEEHKNEYIRYVYLKYMLDDAGIPSTGGKIDKAALKGRMDPIIKSSVAGKETVYQVVSASGKAHTAKNLTLEEAKRKQAEIQKKIDKYRKAIGLVEDVSIAEPVSLSIALQNVAAYDKLSKIADNPDWVWQPSVIDIEGTKWGIGALGKEIEGQAKMVADSPESVEIKERYDMLNNAFEKAKEETGNEPSDFLTLPTSARYGKLSGMVVRKAIYRDLVPIFSGLKGDKALSKTVNAILTFETQSMELFKISKTALNIPTMARNVISNFVQLNLSGIPIYDVPYYSIKGLESIIKKDANYVKAFRSGLFKTNFVEGELMEIYDVFKKMNRNSWFDIVAHITKLAKFYGKIDDVFKMAKYIEQTENGISHGEAIVEAQKWGMDYSSAHPSVKYLRRHVIPLASYSYKITPLLLESMVKRPWVLAKYLAVPAIMNAMAKEFLDFSDDEWEELWKRLPFFIKKSDSILPLPYKSEEGNPKWIDLGYFFPGQIWLALYNNIKHKDVWEIPRTVGISNPLIELLFQLPSSARGTGIPKDPFTGRDIYNTLDEPSEKVFKTLEWVYNKWAPQMVTRFGTAGKIAEIGKENKYGQIGTVGKAAGSLFGVNIISPTEEQVGKELYARLKQLETSYYKGVKDALGDENKIESLKRNYKKQAQAIIEGD